MPIRSIEPRRLYRQIAAQLRVMIEAGEYAVGSRLPPERDLAAQLGVSRPSVREALIALEVEGRVEVRMGSGVYVRAPDPRRTPAPVSAQSPLETLLARRLIESELAAHAASHIDPDRLAGLHQALALMQHDIAAGHTPQHADRLFHLRIAEVSENSVLVRLVGELFDERLNPLYQQLGSHFETSATWSAALVEHRALLDAIGSGSPEAARRAMADHLSRAHDRFMAHWPADAVHAARSAA